MLSKIMTILLGIIEQQPVNAYELNKWLSTMHVRDWYPIAGSTVYATLKTAEKKGFIIGNTEKSGNMPEKTVYSITESGKLRFVETIKSFLIDFEYDITPFSIGMFFIQEIESKEAIFLLEKRIERLKKYNEEVALQIDKMTNNKVPKLFILNTKQNLYIVQAQLKGAVDILAEMKKM
ncbi:transcriptional regulator PadR-like family protein [Anaerotignum neopropionicum]|uniref:Transcriptional regulator PadR-like family protein n=1 Tax=Anaerotignum neopropionicum TaxID=36847 RepID=A0A136WCC1_9FIRM|nr:PadR family transcriptional regulator [Anaerotignum neopropionicum]KXL51989.1 transcriptional regulator PadR-like family protein [Anaerotignum neopropionicum]